MSYGLKIRLEYDNDNDNRTRVDILQRDYAGAYIERELDGAEPVQKSVGDKSSGGNFPVIFGSELKVKFIPELDGEFLSLYTSDNKKFQVNQYVNDSLNWSGYLSPENWTEPLTALPYAVEATATDQLGSLKDIPFTDIAGAPYEGNYSIIQLIALVLQKTDLALPINTAIDYTESAQSAGTDTLSQHYLKAERFEGMKCADVLEQLAVNCRVFQRLGQWWIISNGNFKNDSVAYFHYDATGSYLSASTISLLAAGWWYLEHPELEILPAVRQLVIVQDLGYNSNAIPNGEFVNYDNLLEKFESWENVAVTPKQLDLDTDGNKFVYIPGREYPDDYSSQGYGLITHGIYTTLAVKQTESWLKINLKYAEVGTGYAGLMFIKIMLIGAQTYYLRRTPYVFFDMVNHKEPDPGFEWWNQADKPSQGDDHITLGSSLKLSSAYHQAHPEAPAAYYNTFDPVTAYPLETITQHFSDFMAKIQGLPEDGTLAIYLYVPYSTRTQTWGSAYANLKLEFVDANDEPYPQTSAYKATNSLNNNYTPDNQTILIGDYPDLPNADIIYKGGMKRADGTFTAGWNTPDAAGNYTFGELVARMLASQQYAPRQNYQVKLKDIQSTLALIIVDPTSSKRLVEYGISYDDRMEKIEGQYIEILTSTPAEPTIETAVNFDENGNSATSGTSGTSPGVSAKTQNEDYRVEIVDQYGTKVSQPAYLADEYYDALITERGFFRVQLKNKALLPYFMSPDAGQPLFTLKGVIVEANVGGDANAVTITAGQIISLNANALDALAIQALRDTLSAYDPTRAWDVAATSITLPTDDTYFLYAKVTNDDTSTDCTLVADTAYIVPTFDTAYIYYLLGIINAPEAGVRQVSMLWGNVAPEAGTGDTDEKVKYDAADPTAGYLSEKVVAGEGIVVDEGTGVDENKVRISTNIQTSVPGAITAVTYGFLYNWWAATDTRNIANTGWHVPNVSDYQNLATALGGTSVAGGKMKETGFTYWNSPNTGASNSANFNGKGCGGRSDFGAFVEHLSFSRFWTTETYFFDSTIGRVWQLIFSDATFTTPTGGKYKYNGQPIRLVKDSTTLTHGQTGTYTGNDGKVYRTICIGTQEWLADNLCETKYRNGDLITGPTFTDAEWAALTTEAYCIYNDDPTNAFDGTNLVHNSLSGLQGGTEFERYHLTKAEHDALLNTLKDWIEFDFLDFSTGTAKTYVLNLKALVAYTIDSAVFQVDNGTLTVNVKINGTAVTGLDSLSVSTTLTETAATAANTVAAGDQVTLEITTTYTGTPTEIVGQLNLTRS